MSLRRILFRTINQRRKYGNAAMTVVRLANQDKHQNEYDYQQHVKNVAIAIFGSVIVGSLLKAKLENSSVSCENRKANTFPQAGEKRPDLPTYKADEVSKHDNKSSFWVTYRHGVYDVTEFIGVHPGGEQILNAAGLSIEPFWNVYGMHKTEEVFKLLETYRIGNLDDDDIVDHSDEELWVKEPFRDKRLIVKTAKPFNAEIPPEMQIAYFDTPNELFYVRQHMPVPELDAAHHTVSIAVHGDEPVTKEFTLKELAQMFPTVSVRAALMCAGNRRSEMNKVKPVKGLDWRGGAISNAVWTGVPLRDVLIYCGVDPNDTEGKHVTFLGSDIDATGERFSTSIPLQQALNPNGRILLATHMNGQPLPLDHGHPLRVVVPGAPAVRSVKWLAAIKVSYDESPSHWHQKDYRSFNASKTWETADFASAPPVYSLPVTSAICDPLDGDTVEVKDGLIEIRGYAYSGGGAKILRVDVSGDGGRNWHQAHQMVSDNSPPTMHYSWTLWTANVPVASGQTEVEIWAKATDSNFNTQPEKFEDIWNIRGILSNAYHKIKVKLQHKN